MAEKIHSPEPSNETGNTQTWIGVEEKKEKKEPDGPLFPFNRQPSFTPWTAVRSFRGAARGVTPRKTRGEISFFKTCRELRGFLKWKPRKGRVESLVYKVYKSVKVREIQELPELPEVIEQKFLDFSKIFQS